MHGNNEFFHHSINADIDVKLTASRPFVADPVFILFGQTRNSAKSSSSISKGYRHARLSRAVFLAARQARDAAELCGCLYIPFDRFPMTFASEISVSVSVDAVDKSRLPFPAIDVTRCLFFSQFPVKRRRFFSLSVQLVLIGRLQNRTSSSVPNSPFHCGPRYGKIPDVIKTN